MDSVNEIEYARKPLILIIDDVLRNLQVVDSILYEAGYDVAIAENGENALEILKNITPDLILLDVMMPGIDGFEVCKRIKKIPGLSHVPVIFITSRTNTEDILHGFKIGGVDYIIKPVEKEVLLARLKTHLDLKFSREELEFKTNEIQKFNDELLKLNIEKDKYLTIINKELETAAEYVTNLLPVPMTKGKIHAHWKFVPSTQLGGDSFGYHWIDEDNLAIYLLDVCYHGIGPALLSVSVLNLLRYQNLRKTDFKDPAEVLTSLNNAFQMTDHNDMYFSVWYGVYNLSSGIMNFASAGHPPPMLIDRNGMDNYLETKNIFIGVTKNYKYKNSNIKIPKPSKLFIFSDGVYEIEKFDNQRWTLGEFYSFLKEAYLKYKNNGLSLEMEEVYHHAVNLRNGEKLRDDFSILKVTFL